MSNASPACHFLSEPRGHPSPLSILAATWHCEGLAHRAFSLVDSALLEGRHCLKFCIPRIESNVGNESKMIQLKLNSTHFNLTSFNCR